MELIACAGQVPFTSFSRSLCNWGQTWSCKTNSSQASAVYPQLQTQRPLWASRCWISWATIRAAPCAQARANTLHLVRLAFSHTYHPDVVEWPELCAYPEAAKIRVWFPNPPVLANSTLGLPGPRLPLRGIAHSDRKNSVNDHSFLVYLWVGATVYHAIKIGAFTKITD